MAVGFVSSASSASTTNGTATCALPTGPASGEPANYQFTCPSGAGQRVTIQRFNGVDATTPVLTATGTGGNDDAPPSTGVEVANAITGAAGAMLAGFWAVRTTAASGWTALPSGMTLAGQVGVELMTLYQALTAAGSTGTRSATYAAASRFIAGLTALRAASGTGVEVLLATQSVDSGADIAQVQAPSGWTLVASIPKASTNSLVHVKVWIKQVAAVATQPTWAPSTTATGGTVTWAADMTQADAVAAGHQNDSQQRQDATGAYLTTDPLMPWPMAIEPAPWGSPVGSRATVCRVGESRRRNEIVPNVATWKNGQEYYVGLSLAVDADMDRLTQGQQNGPYQTVWQLRPSNFTGSPPVSLEIGQGNAHLWATGGNARPGASPDWQYAWSRDLGLAVEACTWLDLVLYVGVWSDAASGRFCVWNARTDALLLDFVPPCGTNWPAGTTGSQDDGSAYPKDGIYHSGALRGATVRKRWHRQGTSYQAVKPTLGVSEWRADSALVA